MHKRLLFRLILVSWLVGMGVTVGWSQSEVLHGPVLGLVPNSDGSAIWPVLGIPGAAIFGDRLVLGTDIHSAIVSAKQDYALAVRNEDARAIVIHFSGASPDVTELPADSRADVIALSTNGSAAAVYDSESKTIRLFGGMPDAAELVSQSDTANVAGAVTWIAVSDDGTTALVKFAGADDTGFWEFDSSGASSRISIERASAAAFFANSHDVVVTDDATQALVVINDVARTAVQLPLVSSVGILGNFSAVAVSPDNGQVFAADANGNVMIVDMQTRTASSMSCDCRLTGLSHLKPGGVLRLNEPSEELMRVLDASSGNPRILVVPRPQ